MNKKNKYINIIIGVTLFVLTLGLILKYKEGVITLMNDKEQKIQFDKVQLYKNIPISTENGNMISKSVLSAVDNKWPHVCLDIDFLYATYDKSSMDSSVVSIINKSLLVHVLGIKDNDKIQQDDSDKMISDAVDSFGEDFFREYKEEVLPLYMSSMGTTSCRLENNEWYNYKFELKTSVCYSCNGNVINYQYEERSYSGGLQEFYSVHLLNFDKTTGQLIELDDILNSKQLNTLKDKLFQELMKQTGVNSLQELRDKGFLTRTEMFVPETNFFYTDEGLVFVYNPYEISSSEHGIIRIQIPDIP